MIKLSCIMPKSQVVDALLLWVLRRVKSRTDLLIWVQPFVAPSVVIATKKIIADDRSLCFTVAPTRRRHFRQDIAQILAVIPGRLTLRPARIPLTDHAYRGHLVRHLYVATLLPPGGNRSSVCLLDLRPLLLGFTWYSAKDGLLPIQRIKDRFLARVPNSYHDI